MTSDNTVGITPEPESFIYLPDPPEESKDGMVFDHLSRTGNAYFLNQYMGNLKTTVHNSRRYISPVVTGDPTREYNGEFLAADRLVDGLYQPMIVKRMEAEVWQGYSPVLDLNIRWERGELVFYDPVTGQRIATLEDERARADAEQARADTELCSPRRRRGPRPGAGRTAPPPGTITLP